MLVTGNFGNDNDEGIAQTAVAASATVDHRIRVSFNVEGNVTRFPGGFVMFAPCNTKNEDVSQLPQGEHAHKIGQQSPQDGYLQSSFLGQRCRKGHNPGERTVAVAAKRGETPKDESRRNAVAAKRGETQRNAATTVAISQSTAAKAKGSISRACDQSTRDRGTGFE
jgi:hypothetical protein